MLPELWVEKIFTKLTVAYGREFLGRWEGLNLAAVKADWAEELAGYASHPYALKYGLEHLPADKPPTARAFKALCNTVPVITQMALPAPHEQAPDAVRKRLSTVGQVIGDPKAWAKRLRDIEKNHGGCMPSGLQMTRAQREMWRTALPESAMEAA